ncbi:MAG: bifunctional folylpolyglutamate synthase/dihydrofolate synthase [Thermoplasmatota archaeon]
MDPFDYLETRGHFNINPGLERMERLMRSFGSPQLSIPAVHIGGTNGKGSTAAIVEAIMREFPIRTGVYTSPHLLDITERLRIDGSDVDRDTLGRAMSRVLEVDTGEELTYFELVTGASMLVMEEMGIDLNVCEVGMGGRWDATNVIEPQAIAITSISMDHMEHLGDDPVSITLEKCGIIKPSTPVVVGEVCSLLDERERCLRTILDQCTHNGCPVILMSSRKGVERKKELLSSYNIPDWRIASVECLSTLKGTTASFRVHGPDNDRIREPKFDLVDRVLQGQFTIPLLGLHQAYNIGIGVSLSLLSLPFALSHSKLQKGDTSALSNLISGCTEEMTSIYTCSGLRDMMNRGLKGIHLKGRMERIVRNGREFYMDGGHNIEAARSVASTLGRLHPDRKCVLLLAMMGDKEVSEFLGNLDLDIDSVILTTLPYDRSMSTRELLQGVVRSGIGCVDIHIRQDIREAVALWEGMITEEDIGLATGSFYLYPHIISDAGGQNV